jgi:tetratricopeptide (TPR) repeat protein
MLVGSAVARVESEGAGLAILDEAATFAREHGAHAAVAAEIEHHRALVFWTRRDLDRAESIARTVARAGADIISARGYQLCGFVSAARGQHAEAYHRFLEALHVLTKCEQRDEHLTATLLNQVAIYEAELRGSIAIPDRRLSSYPVSIPSLEAATVQRTFAAIYEAYGALIEDNAEKAFAQATLADALAPTQAYRCRTLAFRARVSRVYEEMRNAREFITHAAELAEAFDWDGADDDEAISLLAVAEELRWYDVPRAQGLVDRYESIGGKKDALLVRTYDPRYRAIEDLLIGAVRSMGPERNLDAIARLRRACSTFRSIGYLTRTAWALIELHDAYSRSGVSSPHDYFLESAEQMIQQHFPRSFLARRIGTWGRGYEDGIGLNRTVGSGNRYG